MVTILSTALKVIPLTIAIVFVIQLLRLAHLANRNDTSRPTMRSSILLVLTMPFGSPDRRSVLNLVKYYGELITGIMYAKYRDHVISTVSVVTEVEGVEPETRAHIVSNFTGKIVEYNLTHSTDLEMFVRSTQNSMVFLSTLLNKDVGGLMHYGLNERDRNFEPYIHTLLTRITETARINDITTNAVILISIEYLNRLNLEELYSIK